MGSLPRDQNSFLKNSGESELYATQHGPIGKEGEKYALAIQNSSEVILQLSM